MTSSPTLPAAVPAGISANTDAAASAVASPAGAPTPFRCAPLIKEVGRGAHGARALSRETVETLFTAIFDGRVSDLELGALLMAYRIKGEEADELAGMLAAAQTRLTPIPVPAASGDSLPPGAALAVASAQAADPADLAVWTRLAAAERGTPRPVSIPSYNGARKMPNLTPLLASLLAQRGVPVVVHGVRRDATRVTSAQIFAEMGLPPVTDIASASARLRAGQPAFVPIDVLSPGLDRLLKLRAVMGVRNSAHTLVKLLDVFACSEGGPAGEHAGTEADALAASIGAGAKSIRLVSYTHPPYRDSMSALFRAHPALAGGDILLARGTEGEAVADTRRQVQVDLLRNGTMTTLLAPARSDALESDPALAGLPDGDAALDAAATAAWIKMALHDPARVPVNIARQVDLIEALAYSDSDADGGPEIMPASVDG